MTNNHTDFILSPITDILREVVAANAGISNGIESYPLCDYIMQSVFLKMTGFQEQKLKCICWEMASNDYEYRYELLKSKLGECSNYEDKKRIYSSIIGQTKKIDSHSHFEVKKLQSDLDKQKIVEEIKSIFSGSHFESWAQQDFNKFILDKSLLNLDELFNDDKNLFNDKKPLKKIYEATNRHRNRCAHNTVSYQQNSPDLSTLIKEEYKYENYFVRFGILVLIDQIFVLLYKNYLEVLEANNPHL